MSRIGKQPIIIKDNVTANINNSVVTITGPKGTLEYTLRPEVKAEILENQIVCSLEKDTKDASAYWGLTRALINNMINGVTEGYSKKLQLVGVGYRVKQNGKGITLSVGYSHPVEIPAPEGIELKVEDNTTILITGIDKQLVGLTAAKIRKVRPPEPYKGKGIKYSDEVVRLSLIHI